MVLEGGGVGEDKREGSHTVFVSLLHTSANTVSDEFGLGLSLVVPAMDLHTTAVYIHPCVIAEGPVTQFR